MWLFTLVLLGVYSSLSRPVGDLEKVVGKGGGKNNLKKDEIPS